MADAGLQPRGKEPPARNPAFPLKFPDDNYERADVANSPREDFLSAGVEVVAIDLKARVRNPLGWTRYFPERSLASKTSGRPNSVRSTSARARASGELDWRPLRRAATVESANDLMPG